MAPSTGTSSGCRGLSAMSAHDCRSRFRHVSSGLEEVAAIDDAFAIVGLAGSTARCDASKKVRV